MTTRNGEAGNASSPLAVTDGSNVAVAAVIGGGIVTLWAIRRGFSGIGDFQLRGSTIGAVEWLAYMAVVSGTIRILSVNYPENRALQALNFVS